MTDPAQLSRRERQIMEIVYTRGEASVNDVLEDLPDPPTRTAVRTLLRILEEKGHVKHRQVGREFVYKPTKLRRRAGLSNFRNVLQTYFDGSLENAVAAHLADRQGRLSEDELKRIADLIDEARKRGQ